jgi:hypothetical protein
MLKSDVRTIPPHKQDDHAAEYVACQPNSPLRCAALTVSYACTASMPCHCVRGEKYWGLYRISVMGALHQVVLDMLLVSRMNK